MFKRKTANAPVSRNGMGAATYTAGRPMGGSSKTPRGASNIVVSTFRTAKTVVEFALRVVAILVAVLGMAVAVSYITTDTISFGYDLPTMRKIRYVYLDPNREMRAFTLEEIALYKGEPGQDVSHIGYGDEDTILLAIMGKVYDVTNGRRFYGPHGSYSFFAGRDASRAYVTGCFKDAAHLTPDTRGLTKEELEGIQNWENFFANSHKYFVVGHISDHTWGQPLNPEDPIPGDCTGKDKRERRL